MGENIQQFMNNQNMSLLWEVLLDELNITNNDTNMASNVRTVFDSNVTPFTNSMKHNNVNLVNMNKQFLSQVFTAINHLFPNRQQRQQQHQIKKIKISETEIEGPYNVEDIKQARQSDFEIQFNQKRNEFEDSITLKKPPTIDFSYKETDEKITEMDNLIKETMKQRNFDINTIQNTYTLDNKTSEWLNVDESSKINTNDKPNIELKSVTWDDNNINLDISEPVNISNNNIFNKLKKTERPIPIQMPESHETSVNELQKLHIKIDSLYEMVKEILSNQQQTNKINVI